MQTRVHITEILLKVALNTIKPSAVVYFRVEHHQSQQAQQKLLKEVIMPTWSVQEENSGDKHRLHRQF
jgi:hypothetical protein